MSAFDLDTFIAEHRDAIAAFCARWQITEFALFGSILRDDFGPESDVDVLVEFKQGAPWHLIHLIAMEQELSALFGRSVDLVERRGVERSPSKGVRRTILESAEIIYAA